MPTKSKTPVVSFSPQLMTALLKATLGQVRVDFTQNPKRAPATAMRLNQLRQAMRRENHEHADRVYRVKVLAELGPDKQPTGWLILSPKDSEFEEELSAAGIEAPELGEILEAPEPEPVPGKPRPKGKPKGDTILPWDLGSDLWDGQK